VVLDRKLDICCRFKMLNGDAVATAYGYARIAWAGREIGLKIFEEELEDIFYPSIDVVCSRVMFSGEIVHCGT
jgi:hypothetical protein